MTLSKYTRKICTIVTPRGLYEYLSKPMGIVMISDLFQTRLARLFAHLSHMLVYIDDIAIIGYRTFDNYLKGIKQVLDILCNSGMQVNTAEYTDEIVYHGFILITYGVKPHSKTIKKSRQSCPSKE